MGWKKGKKRQQFNFGQRGEHNSQAKLRNADIPKIRRLLNQGYTIWEIAKLYPVSHTCIWMIVNNKTWRYL